jgi:hypothetical protein
VGSRRKSSKSFVMGPGPSDKRGALVSERFRVNADSEAKSLAERVVLLVVVMSCATPCEPVPRRVVPFWCLARPLILHAGLAWTARSRGRSDCADLKRDLPPVRHLIIAPARTAASPPGREGHVETSVGPRTLLPAAISVRGKT